jgi:hypothetical protein
MNDSSASAPRGAFLLRLLSDAVYYVCFLMPRSPPSRRNIADAATLPLTKALAPASPPDNGATG